jgi:prepilin-type N-terminal cleavage/methylation domain-containing protein
MIQKFTNKKLHKGFTLIELLVVISIIGILAALSLVSFSTAQKQAKDVQRKSDLKQYQTALEGFANNHDGLYPSRGGTESNGWNAPAAGSLCTDLGMTSCPDDPLFEGEYSFHATEGIFSYRYVSDGLANGSIDATKYVLWDKLESSANYWVICSNGKVGAKTQTGWTSPDGGVCPL